MRACGARVLSKGLRLCTAADEEKFFRRRSISYRGRGNFATQLSFSQPIVKLAVWLYFIICILVIAPAFSS